MEPVIAQMVNNFEHGKLSRRQLVEGLAALVVATGGAAAGARSALAATPEPLPATNVDHVSILVKDLEASTKFYETVFNLEGISADKEHKILRMAPKGTRHAVVSLRQQEPYGTVDHFALGLAGFDKDATTARLKEHGLKAEENLEYGYFVRDLDGYPVQMTPGMKR
jgi:catechol 2,3-dioxygenase-like lactoylglutathione lyase family enzyme